MIRSTSRYRTEPLRQGEVPRLFEIVWDNTRLKLRSPYDRERKHRAFGTLYPSGRVTLDDGAAEGAGFRTWSELEHHFGLAGEFEVKWLDRKE